MHSSDPSAITRSASRTSGRWLQGTVRSARLCPLAWKAGGAETFDRPLPPGGRPRTVSIMSVPLCPVVLQLLAVEPRDVRGVVRELARRELAPELAAHQAATVTLGRLQRAGLIYARGAASSPRVFRVTDHGRRELGFQCGVARGLGATSARRSANFELR
jgi:hypothetical protein